jgi:hypothetical protein
MIRAARLPRKPCPDDHIRLGGICLVSRPPAWNCRLRLLRPRASARREIFLWAAIGLFANQALLLVDVGSNRDFATSLAEQNYVFWLACYAVIYRLHASDRGVRATGFDRVLALAI